MIADENRYLDYLTENDILNISSVVIDMLEEDKELNSISEVIQRTTLLAVGPILISFVLWVLKQAEKENVKRLYFLARDGLVMHEIAKIFVVELKLDIELKYLYCSRKSLRNVISFIDQDEAIEQLACYSTNTTINGIFNRMNLSDYEIDSTIDAMNLNKDEINLKLDINELLEFKDKLRKCNYIIDLLNSKSKLAYATCIDYFRQEKLLNSDKFAFVDSGWSGSMQKNFRVILEYQQDKKVDLLGYYFGITNKTDEVNGIYRGFYLNSRTLLDRMYKFNNNLLEIFCSADHGMTIGYEKSEEGIVPQLASYNEKWPVGFQIGVMKKLVTNSISSIRNVWGSIDGLDIFVEPLVEMIMYDPLRREIETYGNMMFDDDLSENNLVPLAKKYSAIDYYENFILVRIIRKITGTVNMNCRESLWQYGSINAVESKLLRFYLKVNYIFWISLKIIYNKIKKG